MTNKARAYLTSLATNEETILQIGKGGVTPEYVQAVEEAIAKRELIKISILKNCMDDPRAMAEVLAERTNSEIVRIIGRKIILYRPAKKPVIKLPSEGK